MKPISDVVREQIKQRLKYSLEKHVSSFKYKNSQPLDLLIPRERKIRSVVGGLETSMGTTVWEPIAKTLAVINGFEVLDEKILRPDPFPKELAVKLNSLITLRENGKTWISSEKCISHLKIKSRQINRKNIHYVPPAAGTGVDLYFRKNGVDYVFDIKTVKPNVGSIKSFNKEILEWYAFKICKDPESNIKCKIAYPYNPYTNDFWTHSPHNRGILEPGIDAVVENQFWDFLSGMKNTYQFITDIFIELNSEGFGTQLSDLIETVHGSLLRE